MGGALLGLAIFLICLGIAARASRTGTRPGGRGRASRKWRYIKTLLVRDDQ